MEPRRETLTALRDRVAALQATPCGMAHEAILSGPDRKPMKNSQNQSGYSRVGVCVSSKRAAHVGCSHTMARYALQDALNCLPGEDSDVLLAKLQQLEGAISLLDHRRYDAECRRADAVLTAAADKVAIAEIEIARLVSEHRSYVAQAIKLRDEVLRRLNGALLLLDAESQQFSEA
jgi:hypothetical protein